jgi:hypothetical protein
MKYKVMISIAGEEAFFENFQTAQMADLFSQGMNAGFELWGNNDPNAPTAHAWVERLTEEEKKEVIEEDVSKYGIDC